MNHTVAFQLTGITKHFGSFMLRPGRLAIQAGEIFCLLGPTGSGKSTLLRLLSGLERPTEGEIRFRGEMFNGKNLPLSIQRLITMVHQRPLLLSGTVRANVEYGLKLRCKDRCELRVANILSTLGLSHLAGRKSGTLSGGQTQLVALARALVLEPEVLLLDEPTANLDPAHVDLVERAIVQNHSANGMSIVWATHNLFQARRIAHRVGLLLNGSLVEVAEPQAFFTAPDDPRTADFVQGKMVY